MEKEKSSVEITGVFVKTPDLFVIKGRQNETVSLSLESVYTELRKIAGLKENATLQFRIPLENRFKRIVKRSIDILSSTIIIAAVLSWMIPLMALLIKLDSKGPVFLLQKRNKKDGKIFTCIKLRTMAANDEAYLVRATEDDERITKLGRFLRNHYFDIFPQFLNVWIGDMSLIGPSPHMISDNNKYEESIAHYDFRHKVKPGVTGLSQVMGYAGEARAIQEMRDRVHLDIFYIRHWSFLLDLKIAGRTLRNIFK